MKCNGIHFRKSGLLRIPSGKALQPKKTHSIGLRKAQKRRAVGCFGFAPKYDAAGIRCSVIRGLLAILEPDIRLLPGNIRFRTAKKSLSFIYRSDPYIFSDRHRPRSRNDGSEAGRRIPFHAVVLFPGHRCRNGKKSRHGHRGEFVDS